MSKPPIEWTDKNDEIIKSIVENCELREQLILRQVSRRFCHVIDASALDYRTIHVSFGANHVFVKFNDERCRYSLESDPITAYGYRTKSENLAIIESKNYLEMAFKDVAFALKNGKNRLESLFFEYHPREKVERFEATQINAIAFFLSLIALLTDLPHQIAVEKFSIQDNNLEICVSILSFLEPGTLKQIEIVNVSFPNWDDAENAQNEESIDKLIETDQWKWAERINLIHTPITVPVSHFFHFTHVEICVKSLSIEQIVVFKNAVLENPNFRCACLYTREDFNLQDLKTLEETLNIYQKPNDPWPHYRSNIPGFQGFMVVYVGEFAMFFKKRRRLI